MLSLVFMLDITGSMSCELDGVKETVARLVNTVYVDHKKDLLVTIITFTEEPHGCYVTRHTFDDGTEAAAFVSSIKLCYPPGLSGVSAGGGDGPENSKAALAELLLLDSDIPTVAFLITDAAPHLTGVNSQEARCELEHLRTKHQITDADLFSLLNRLYDHYEDSLVLSVLKYGGSELPLYGAVAKRFNGVLITPQRRTSAQLADGLMVILSQIFHSVLGGGSENPTVVTDQTALSAFTFYDLENVVVPESERGRSRIAAPLVGATDELLSKLVERTTVIAGGRFKKRAITSHLVCEQVELLLVLAKGLLSEIHEDEALERATLLLDKITRLMGEEHASQFKLTIESLRDVLRGAKAASGTTALSTAVSAITLMSIEETARDIFAEEEEADGDGVAVGPRDPSTMILSAASLFLGHLAVLELPTRMGVVDFMDAWSAAIHKVSNDVVSAADYLAMIGTDKTSVSGLSMRDREYNFLQLVADPSDAVGSELLRLASGTQILDILTALLSGAPSGLFSPNMFRGTISACLMTLLASAEELSEFQWHVADKMVHTVRLLMGVAPSKLTLEPESAMGKLLFRVLRVKEVNERALRWFLEEMAAARAQKFAKFNQSGYLSLIEDMVAYTHKGVDADPFEHHVLLDDTELAIDESHAVEAVAKSEFAVGVERCARNVLRAVYAKSGSVPSLQQVWPSYTNDLPKLLLLQKRTERYTLVADKSDKSWVREESVMAGVLGGSQRFRQAAWVQMHAKYEMFVRSVRATRADQMAAERWRMIVALARAPMDEFLNKLSVIVPSSSRREHKLLLNALTVYQSGMGQDEYEAKATVVITGRTIDTHRVVFNRGNLHPHPDRVLPLTDEFKGKLRMMQREYKWSLAHQYRESGIPNHSGFCTAVPSAWAAKRSLEARTFWEAD